MSVATTFILGFICYAVAAFLSNSPYLKSLNYYLYLGLIVGCAGNLLWFSLAQKVQSNSKILILGFYWDMIILLSFLTVPILFYNATLKPLTILGLLFMFMGFVLTKVG